MPQSPRVRPTESTDTGPEPQRFTRRFDIVFTVLIQPYTTGIGIGPEKPKGCRLWRRQIEELSCKPILQRTHLAAAATDAVGHKGHDVDLTVATVDKCRQ